MLTERKGIKQREKLFRQQLNLQTWRKAIMSGTGVDKMVWPEESKEFDGHEERNLGYQEAKDIKPTEYYQNEFFKRLHKY